MSPVASRPVRNTVLLVTAVAAFLATSVASFAQAPPPGGPAPQGAPLPGGQLPPGALPGGAPPSGEPPDAPSPFGPPPEPPLSEAQILVRDLPSPMPGGMMPVPPLAPDAPLPAPDPRDFQGTWYHNQNLLFRNERDMYGFRLPYTMEGAKVISRRVMSLRNGTPFINASSICRPPGQQWQHDLNMPFQIFQSKDWIEFMFEEYHGRWKILLDPSSMPPPKNKEYMGYSTGRWDGNTLVVETRDYKQALWLDVDGTPLSVDGKLIQRIRKVQSAEREPMLEIITTVVDPAYYTKPWSMVRSFGWQPALTLFNEYNCEEQIGDPNVNPDAALVPEPQ